MSKQNSWNENKLNRYLKEGRGCTAEGSEYKPWLTISDFPTMGRMSRIRGWRSNRVIQLFSDIESRYFFLLDWNENDNILDIREQFPLLDLEEVLKEEKDLNLDAFKDKESGITYVFTTTFMITLMGQTGQKIYIARNVKNSTQLEKKITIERLEILRRYFQIKGINWGLVTQKDIPVIKAKNIEWLHSSLDSSEERGFTEEELQYLGKCFINKVRPCTMPLRAVINEFDKEFMNEPGTGLFIFKYLIASKKIKIDMNRSINLNETVDKIIISVKESMEVKSIANY